MITTSGIILIAVHYKNDEQTKNFLNKICDLDIEIHIADNSSAIKPLDYTHKNITVHSLPENPGYFGAVQEIYTKIGKPQNSKLIISNTDVSFNSDLINQLQKIKTTAGLIAPKVTSGINSLNSNPLYLERPSNAQMKRIRMCFSFYLSGAVWQVLGYLKQRFLKKNRAVISNQYIYAAHGSFMIFTPEYFKSGLSFDYPIFLYGEEIWVAELMAKKSLKTIYNPNLEVIHLEHGSLGIWPSYVVWKAHYESNLFLEKEFFYD